MNKAHIARWLQDAEWFSHGCMDGGRPEQREGWPPYPCSRGRSPKQPRQKMKNEQMPTAHIL